MDFNSLNNTQIKNWLIRNKVCIVTNSRMTPGTLFLSSFRTYADYLPTYNYWCVPGEVNGQMFYGMPMFTMMVQTLIRDRRFDYVIYIDEDCFIKDFRLLLSDFEKFINGNYCIGGVQDGGVLCHRNHSSMLINTFLSYWNIKAVRESRYFDNPYNMQNMKNYIEFRRFLDTVPELKKEISELALRQIDASKKYRTENYSQRVPYCDTVENDVNNPIEPHQTPYSSKDDTDENNFEPYYQLEEMLVQATRLPLYYMNGNDLYSDEPTELDNTGMTSVVMTEDGKHFAYHTWFSRAYDIFAKDDLRKFHTERINKIIKHI